MGPTKIVFIVLLVSLASLTSMSANAVELYRWVDVNSVTHFSQWPPAEDTPGVKKQTLNDTTPASYDPDEDRYGVSENAEHMQALWDEREQKRKERRKRQEAVPQQTIINYQQPAPYYSGIRFPYYPDRPIYKPPHNPDRPIYKPSPSPVPLPIGAHPFRLPSW